MSNPAVQAIHTELKRLQSEGVDRVFLDDDTLRLIKQPKEESAPLRAAPQKLNSALASLGTDSPATQAMAAPTPATTEPKAAPSHIKPLPEQAPAIELPEGDSASRMAWLRKLVEGCETCKEHLSEFGKIVFGEGNPEADIFFCGEAPSADDEKKGEPFVGAAGQLLTKIIGAMGLKREEVYIGNILKWRPEHDKPYGNRPPTLEEMNFCLPYLKAQLEIIQPKVIVALGNTTVTGLLGHDPNRKLGQVRGQWHEFEGTPLMISFHPSYLLRNDTMKTKRMAWEDMLKVMEKVGMPINEKQQGYFLPKG